nr:hypothetical protein [Arachidicoccus ginsenosidivorans]
MDNGRFSANYRDIFPEIANGSLVPNCSDGGVLPTLAGMIGCMQATEVLKYFANRNAVLADKLSVVNILDGSKYQVSLSRNEQIQINDLEGHMIVEILDYETLLKGSYQLIDVRSFKEHAAFNIGGSFCHFLPFQVI